MFHGHPMCQGNSSLEQLLLILRMLGLPDPREFRMEDYPRFGDYRSNIASYSIPPTDAGLQQCMARASPAALDLARQLLKYNPDSRLSAEDALKHPYFTSLLDEVKARKKGRKGKWHRKAGRDGDKTHAAPHADTTNTTGAATTSSSSSSATADTTSNANNANSNNSGRSNSNSSSSSRSSAPRRGAADAHAGRLDTVPEATPTAPHQPQVHPHYSSNEQQQQQQQHEEGGEHGTPRNATTTMQAGTAVMHGYLQQQQQTQVHDTHHNAGFVPRHS